MSDTPIDAPEFLTRQQAAAFLTRLGIQISVSTLARYACQRRGPPFGRVMQYGPVFYPVVGLRTWATSLDPTQAVREAA